MSDYTQCVLPQRFAPGGSAKPKWSQPRTLLGTLPDPRRRPVRQPQVPRGGFFSRRLAEDRLSLPRTCLAPEFGAAACGPPGLAPPGIMEKPPRTKQTPADESRSRGHLGLGRRTSLPEAGIHGTARLHREGQSLARFKAERCGGNPLLGPRQGLPTDNAPGKRAPGRGFRSCLGRLGTPQLLSRRELP